MWRGRWKLCKSLWIWWLAFEESIQITTFINKANEAVLTEETMTSKKVKQMSLTNNVLLKCLKQQRVCKIMIEIRLIFYGINKHIFVCVCVYIYIYVTLEHKISLKSLEYICNNRQKYIVWVKIIDCSFMPKIIRILSKDHVPWRYFVNFLP